MNEETKKIRKLMGTLSFNPKDIAPEIKHHISKGCSELIVNLIQYTINPYKAMYIFATQTWGAIRSSGVQKWEKAPIEYRFLVVKAVLEGKALPLALEVPTFQFEIIGAARSAFDQIARARIGVVFSSIGVRDNSAIDRYLILHPKLYNNEKILKKIQKWWKSTKDLYIELTKDGKNSWQNARAILPMDLSHNFGMTINYLALKNMLSKRLKFCEQHTTVGIAWSIWKRIYEKFPLLASYLRPACDFSKKCQYYQAYSLSNLFGCLFRPCGRNPVDISSQSDLEKDIEFINEAAADKSELEKELKFHIPEPNEYEKYESIEDLKETDFHLFSAS